MVSLVETDKIASTHALVGETITGATTVTSDALDLREFEGVGFLATVAALTGNGMTKLEIIASAASDGSSPEVIKDSGTIAADAVDDQAFLEATAQEIAQIGANESKDLRYVLARVTLANAADRVALTALRWPATYAKQGLTPATTIA